jgi:hypothetical protein
MYNFVIELQQASFLYRIISSLYRCSTQYKFQQTINSFRRHTREILKLSVRAQFKN